MIFLVADYVQTDMLRVGFLHLRQKLCSLFFRLTFRFCQQGQSSEQLKTLELLDVDCLSATVRWAINSAHMFPLRSTRFINYLLYGDTHTMCLEWELCIYCKTLLSLSKNSSCVIISCQSAH